MNIICEVIKLLQFDDWYGESEQIEIAKGKYELKLTWYERYKQYERLSKMKKIK
jgi:hypothetical protein